MGLPESMPIDRRSLARASWVRAGLLGLLVPGCGKEAPPGAPMPAAISAAQPAAGEPAPEPDAEPRLREIEVASPREAEVGLVVHGAAELGIFARGDGPIEVETVLEGGAPERASVPPARDVRTPAIVALPGGGARAVLARLKTPTGTTLDTVRVKDERPRLPRARSLAGALRGRSLFLVVCDALHAGHVKSFGGARDTSPNVDALAAEGVRFTAARSQSAWTVPSIASLFTGHEQEQHGVRDIGDVLDPGLPTLAEAFRAAGYATAAFVQNRLVNQPAGYARGFDRWEEYASAAEPLLVPALKRFLAEPRDRPLIVYVHILPPHTPYKPPAEFASRFGAADLEIDGSDASVKLLNKAPLKPDDSKVARMTALYDNHVAYGDHLVGEVRRLVEGIGRERAAILFLSDHGEAFAQHGTLGHLYTVHEEMVHVPMVLWAPGSPLRAGAAVDEPVWIPDLVPTIADLFGLDVSDDLPGLSVAGLIEGAAAPQPRVQRLSTIYERGLPRQRAILFGRFKLVAPFGKKPTALFDLAADPGETTDASAQHPVVAAALRGELSRWVAEGVRASSAPDFTPDPELEAELRRLGYVGGE